MEIKIALLEILECRRVDDVPLDVGRIPSQAPLFRVVSSFSGGNYSDTSQCLVSHLIFTLLEAA